MLCEQVLGKLHDFDTTGKTIEYVDKTFDYTASSSADIVSVINNNQINDVVNNG